MRRIVNVKRWVAVLGMVFVLSYVPSDIQGGNLSNIALCLGNPGDLGVDATVTSTLLHVDTMATENNTCLGPIDAVALTTAEVDSRAEIDALEVSVIVLLKTILAEVQGV